MCVTVAFWDFHTLSAVTIFYKHFRQAAKVFLFVFLTENTLFCRLLYYRHRFFCVNILYNTFLAKLTQAFEILSHIIYIQLPKFCIKWILKGTFRRRCWVTRSWLSGRWHDIRLMRFINPKKLPRIIRERMQENGTTRKKIIV